ncbi:MAG TPA: long-chain-fatty-acid--CoA ligase [Acidimicrobiales bacterium]|jgi:acyl-CoA synthetase (AMP-forming)/AMP-acid ligase II
MNLTQSIHRARQQDPQLQATVFGPRICTVEEQFDRVSKLGGALRGLGVEDGDRVGVLALNSDRYIEVLLAVPWAGGVLMPLNTRWSVPEILYALEDSATTVLFVDATFAPLVSELIARAASLKSVVYMDDAPYPPDTLAYEELIARTSPVPDRHRGGDDLAGIFYTGGTTGEPKGVAISHANFMTSALGSLATFPFASNGGRLLHAAPMFHLADLGAWFMQSVVGGTHVILPAFEPLSVLRTIHEEAITMALLVPTMIQMLADHPDAPSYDLSSLRVVLYGASPISSAVLERAMKCFSSAEFVQAYGMTELSPVATLLTPSDHADESLQGSAGRAAAHSEIRIADEDDNDVPIGTVGQILVRGSHVMQGYWNKPEATAEALKGGWMHTGDAGYLNERGYLFVVDRVKDMVISGGENIYSVEVENALAKHPAVASCAVIGVPDDRWGERVHAVVVLKPEQSATLEELQEHARTLISSYKIPRSMEVRETLPISAAGKILKRDLRAEHWGEGARGIN